MSSISRKFTKQSRDAKLTRLEISLNQALLQLAGVIQTFNMRLTNLETHTGISRAPTVTPGGIIVPK